MEFKDIVNVVLGIIASIGGGTVLLLILAKFFGKMWAKAYLEQYKNELKEQFEVEKRKIELEFEKSKTKYLRYSNRQFELYNSLWVQLVELKESADLLWQEASENNLSRFANKLRETKVSVHKSKLFLEKDHFDRLISLLEEFSEYQIGKKKLIDLRLKKNFTDQVKREIAEDYFLHRNEGRKEQYNQIITEIAESFKNQIKHSPAT